MIPKFSKDVFALIPARGGSKSIPHKNIVRLNGKPLVAHSIEQALACSLIQRTFVSTDSKKIAAIARRCGAEVPFLRPKNISGDLATDFEAFSHWLGYLREAGIPWPELIVHLRPTSPLRSPKTILKAIQLLRARRDIDSVRSVALATKSPYKMWKLGRSGLLKNFISGDRIDFSNQPRQLLPPVWVQTATIDVVRTASFIKYRSMTGRRILPLVTSPEETVDIDSPLDLDFAEFLLKKGRRWAPSK